MFRVCFLYQMGLTCQFCYNIMTHFGLSVDDLKSLLEIDNIRQGQSIEMLRKWGKIDQLQKLLHTDFKKGLCKDTIEQNARIEAFEDNRPVVKHPKTIYQQMCDCMEDQLLRYLAFTATLSIIFGLFRTDGWIEGASVLFGVAILVICYSVGNHLKNMEFAKTRGLLTPDKEVQVIRYGKQTIIPSRQLLVGDIMHIKGGDILTIDGILIEGKDLFTDESNITGQSNKIKKRVPITYQQNEKANPFLLSFSTVMEGQGWIVVVAVGRNTLQGQLKLKIMCQQDETPLQMKLGKLADKIGSISIFSTIFCFAVLAIDYICECYSQQSLFDSFFSVNTINQLLKDIIITLCLLMISVPQALPCCVFLTHCLHMSVMFKENIYLRYLNAIEALACVDNLCVDVAQTLIEDNMSVTRIFIEERDHYFVDSKEMLEQTCRMLCLCISCNTTINPVFGQHKKENLNEKASQHALLEAVHNLGFDYQMLRSEDRIKKIFPFDSERKKMAVLYEDEKGRLFIFVRGSEEKMMQNCSHFINKHGKITEINHQYFDLFNEAKKSYIAGGMRTIMLAFKEVGSIPENWQQIQKDLTVLAFIGIKRPLKKGVIQAVSLLQQANITVRILARYQKNATIKVAKEIGLLSPDWQLSNNDLTVMQGDDLKKFIGGLITEKQDYYFQKTRVGNLQNFRLVAQKLRVMVRQHPDGKYCMMVGLKELEHVVAMIDDGIRYPCTLKKADVAIAMKSGSDDAKDISGIVLLDDDFCSILNAVKWGRNVYDAVRKNVQFQLTANLVTSSMIIIGCLCNKQSPLTPFQIIWISTITEFMAPLVLLSEQPSQQLLKRRPQQANDSLVTKEMQRLIVSQGIVQVVILSVVLFKGHEIFGVTSSIGAKQWSEESSKHYSIFFNIFFMLQICNLINARRIKNEYNVFGNLFRNRIALAVILIMVSFQLAMLQFSGRFLRLSPLNLQQILACLLIGTISLMSCLVVKIILGCFDNKVKEQ